MKTENMQEVKKVQLTELNENRKDEKKETDSAPSQRERGMVYSVQFNIHNVKTKGWNQISFS